MWFSIIDGILHLSDQCIYSNVGKKYFLKLAVVIIVIIIVVIGLFTWSYNKSKDIKSYIADVLKLIKSVA